MDFFQKTVSRKKIACVNIFLLDSYEILSEYQENSAAFPGTEKRRPFRPLSRQVLSTGIENYKKNLSDTWKFQHWNGQ
jgi:hypothetical protein